jgi:inner membrane protein
MDSISQAVLGSAVGLIVTGGKQPKKAILAGGLLGTLPDLDSLIPSINSLEATISHRTWSHSWIVQSLVSPVLATALHRFDKSFSWTTWFCLVWFALVTHSILDCFTIYGTDVFWPFSNQTIIGGSVFIIDPLFTLPLVIVVVLSFFSRWKDRVFRIALFGLGMSCMYLGWGLYSQRVIEQMAVTSLDRQKISYNKIIATPTPFNSVLWRILAMDNDQYHEGYYSRLDSTELIRFQSFPRNMENLDALHDLSSWKKLDRFSHRFNAVKHLENAVIGVDLRMGVEDYYFFKFKLAVWQQGKLIGINPTHVGNHPGQNGFFSWLWNRLTSRTTVPFTS